jgi:hypothetical protein
VPVKLGHGSGIFDERTVYLGEQTIKVHLTAKERFQLVPQILHGIPVTRGFYAAVHASHTR